MPVKPKKPCKVPACRNLTVDKYCEDHKDKAKQDTRYYDQHLRDKRSRAFYKSIEWLRVRAQALIRDHYLCQQCLTEKRITPADMVHHIHPVKTHWHLRLVLANLISLCNPCHNSKHGGS